MGRSNAVDLLETLRMKLFLFLTLSLLAPWSEGNGLFLSNCRFHVSVGPEWAWGAMPVAMLNNPEEKKVYRDVLASWLTGEEGQVAMDEPLITNPSCKA